MISRWQGIEEFVQVVKCGSFSAAARTLGISKSHVSQQISKLEDRLASRLLHRTTRKLTLTETGEYYYHRCQQILEDLENTEHSVNQLQEEVQGLLRISSPHLLGESHLVPAIAEFLSEHPKLDIELDFSSKKIDLIAEYYDLALQVGKRKDVNVVNLPLATTRFFIVASPGYLANTNELIEPANIQNHNCLLFMDRGVSKPWLLKKQEDDTPLPIKVMSHWRSNSGPALRAAAKKGLGLAYLPDYYLKQDIEEGSLKILLPEWSFNQREIVAIYPHKNHLSAKTRLFSQFLKAFFERKEQQFSLSV
ncbi:LysR family transcriptional regulator [Aliikangiella coralliicola]|uniref:LysR family transcriptional regulator n=1 Tax=Aliikangiella coralliicola TaxID=2592383 RepID=A0A545UFQ0_9GAMM|nr:LysR family transcriptional regulator [Aliikangiella coralliicola]TQV88301.1 LysR family transcriptional regulator [Aliikangiella coralliicola]